MPEPLLFLQAMGAAAGVSAIVVLTLGWARLGWAPSPASTARLNSACVLGIGSGLALGGYVLQWQWRLAWPPVNGLDRFLTIVVPAALGIELLAGCQRVPRWLSWCLRLSLAAASGRILLHGSVYLSGSSSEWTAWQAVATVAVLGTLLAAVWVLLSWLAERSPGVSIPLAIALATQCAGLTVMLAGYIQGGAAALPLTAALVGVSLALSWLAPRSGVQGTLGIGVVGLFGLLFIGRFFGRLSTGAALAMFLAPLLCWSTELPLLRRRKPWIVASLRLSLVAIPLIAVLVLAKRDFDRKMAPLLTGRANEQRLETSVTSRPTNRSKPRNPSLLQQLELQHVRPKPVGFRKRLLP